MGPPAPVVSLAEWAAWRWAGPLSSFLGTASPDRNVAALPSLGAPAAPGGWPPGGDPRPVARAVWAAGGPRAAGGRAVVRLAPALDERLVVLEVVHRFGSAGVLVLAPSHARAEAVAGRLRDAGTPVAVLPDDWARAATGVPVVVGTRAAAWAPSPACGRRWSWAPTTRPTARSAPHLVGRRRGRRAGPPGRRTVPARHALPDRRPVGGAPPW